VKEIYSAKFKQLPSGYKTLSKEEAKQIKLQPVSPLLAQQESGIRESCALPYEL
jgi:phospholipase C